MIMSGSRRGVHCDTARKFVANVQSLKAMSQFNFVYILFYSLIRKNKKTIETIN